MSRALSIIFVFIFFLLQISCDAWSVISGTVYDSQNKPIESVSVQFSLVGVEENKELWQENVISSKDGKFNLRVGHGMWGTDLRLIAAKDGYKIFVTEMTAKEIQNNEAKYENYKILLEKNE